MFKYFVVFAILLSSLQMVTLAQDDLEQITYNEVLTRKFESKNEQFFASFTATAGDVVYLLAEYEGFVIGSIELDIRDDVGRSIGTEQSYSLEDFVLAEIPADGQYTVVITAEEAEVVNIWLGLSGKLNDGIDVQIKDDDDFMRIYLIDVPESGKYAITYERTKGDLDVNFAINNFSARFTETVVDINGLNIDSWTIIVDLDKGDEYIAFVAEEWLVFGGGKSADVTISIAPLD